MAEIDPSARTASDDAAPGGASPGGEPSSRPGIGPGFGARERDEACWLIERALAEDLPAGDITSVALLADVDGPATLSFVSRESGVVCGVDVVELLFRVIDSAIRVRRLVSDGARIAPGQPLIDVEGRPVSLLSGERVALNFLQRLSGIATTAARWREIVRGAGPEGRDVKLLDTRKTTPGWRHLEKYAVRAGGATNHRMNLSDGFLVKDNHASLLRRAGRASIGDWVAALRHADPAKFLEVEVDSRTDFALAQEAGADAILLDNFSLEDLRWAVDRNRRAERRVLLEASGGVTEAKLRSVAATGVDRISVGALTHSVRALDIGLDYPPGARAEPEPEREREPEPEPDAGCSSGTGTGTATSAGAQD